MYGMDGKQRRECLREISGACVSRSALHHTTVGRFYGFWNTDSLHLIGELGCRVY